MFSFQFALLVVRRITVSLCVAALRLSGLLLWVQYECLVLAAESSAPVSGAGRQRERGSETCVRSAAARAGRCPAAARRLLPLHRDASRRGLRRLQPESQTPSDSPAWRGAR